MPTLTIDPEPILYPKQRAAIYDPARYVWIEASTKSGKTVGCLQWIVNQATLMPRGGNAWWVAPIYAQARIAFDRLKRGLAGCDQVKVNETQCRIELPGPRFIWFKGSENPDSLFGEDVSAACIDEASRVKEESWHAIRSTLTATEGPIRLIGNVKGRKNFFYRGCRAAQQGKAGHAYHKLTAQDAIDAGVLSQAEVLDAEASLPPHVFRELYYAEPSDDGGNPFGLSAIDACIGEVSTDEPVCFGADLAKSVDYNAVIGLDSRSRVCKFEHWQADWGITLQRLEHFLAYVPSYVDSTGVGDPITEFMQRKSGNVTGFKFTSTSKQQIMEGLASAIQRREVTFPEGRIADELREFGYEYTRTGVRYSAPEGLHDDCVCALALAVQCYTAGGYWAGELTAMTSGHKLEALTL
jgi:hypothetical protein